jgi:16S rRNA (guanine527-N7)-methyltransferase
MISKEEDYMSAQNFDLCKQGFSLLGLSYFQDKAIKMLTHLAMLNVWNQRFNLTAISGAEGMIRGHIFDSLSVVSQLPAKAHTVVDIGSGAGFPGLPLAIYCPQLSLTLLEPIAKRAWFLQAVVQQLGLSNVRVLRLRAQQCKPCNKFDVVLARAVAPLPKLFNQVQPLQASRGSLFIWQHNLAKAPHFPGWNIKLQQVDIPGLGERTLLRCRKKNSRNKRDV